MPRSNEGYFLGFRDREFDGGCYAWIPQLNKVVICSIVNWDEASTSLDIAPADQIEDS